MSINIGRRQFISALGGVAVAWPLAARAQQVERVRRVGVLTTFADSDALAQGWDAAFRKGLDEFGLAQRPQRPDRLSLGRRRCRSIVGVRQGTCRAAT